MLFEFHENEWLSNLKNGQHKPVELYKEDDNLAKDFLPFEMLAFCIV